MNKIHKKRIQLWVDALKSGEYKQGKSCLRSIEDSKITYCCLGVACKIYQEHTKKKIEWCYFYLPTEISQWFGLDQFHMNYENIRNPHIFKNTTAVSANDSKGWSFNEIADAIEKTYLKDEP